MANTSQYKVIVPSYPTPNDFTNTVTTITTSNPCGNPYCDICEDRNRNRLNEAQRRFYEKLNNFSYEYNAYRLNEFYMKYETVDNNKKKRNRTMSKITKEIRELTLSEDDQLLRKHKLQDENGHWTNDAVDVMDQILLDERKADLVEKLKAIDAKKTADKEVK